MTNSRVDGVLPLVINDFRIWLVPTTVGAYTFTDTYFDFSGLKKRVRKMYAMRIYDQCISDDKLSEVPYYNNKATHADGIKILDPKAAQGLLYGESFGSEIFFCGLSDTVEESYGFFSF